MDCGAEIKNEKLEMRNAKLWCGAKNNEAPRSFEYMVFTKGGKFESRYEWLGIRDWGLGVTSDW